MAKSKEEVTYGTAQGQNPEEEPLRIRYKHGTPLEGGKISESEPVQLFSSTVEKASGPSAGGDQPQARRGKDGDPDGSSQ